MKVLPAKAALATGVFVLCIASVVTSSLADTDKICGYVIEGAGGQCADCPCGCSPCDGAVSAWKYSYGVYKCVAAPEQVCHPMREDQPCALKYGFMMPNCFGPPVCDETSTTDVNCLHF